jgi:hypothetical protein
MEFFKKEIEYLKKNYLQLGIISSIVLLFLSFIAPFILTLPAFADNLDFSSTGNIGDTIGGIMNPFIAIIASILTFMAFYIQYKANQEVQQQFKIQQFESQFYEMLRLHKENVNELYLKIRKKIEHPDNRIEIVEDVIYGRRVFEYLEYEFMLIYFIAVNNFSAKELIEKKVINEAYGIFFMGLTTSDLEKHKFFKQLGELQNLINNLDYKAFDEILNKALTSAFKFSSKIEFAIFNGHSQQLAHHYRHLFQTVKFVVKQDESFLTYENKRNYLRTLRSQLSNTEQAFLFYNWYSGFGKQWENDVNKFFTDYRMIHNIYNDLLISGIKLEDIFDLNGDFRKEKNRVKDPLFEFEDWV